jgi:hypothetical protein
MGKELTCLWTVLPEIYMSGGKTRPAKQNRRGGTSPNLSLGKIETK